MDPSPLNKVPVPAIFLDRDGVLNEDLGYTYQLKDLKILDGVREGLAKLHQHGFILFIITNQSGVARGYFTLNDVHALNAELVKQLGVPVKDVFVCPHFPTGIIPAFSITCLCRKPSAFFVDEADRLYGIDRTKSFLIGDKDSDMECAKNAGITGVQVKSKESHSKLNFEDAVKVILGNI